MSSMEVEVVVQAVLKCHIKTVACRGGGADHIETCIKTTSSSLLHAREVEDVAMVLRCAEKSTPSSLLHSREVEKAGVHILQVREMEEGVTSTNLTFACEGGERSGSTIEMQGESHKGGGNSPPACFLHTREVENIETVAKSIVVDLWIALACEGSLWGT